MRTDEPGASLRARGGPADRPRGARPADRRRRPRRTAGACCCSSRASRTAPQAEALRGTDAGRRGRPGRAARGPDECYDHQLVGLAVVGLDGTALGAVDRGRAPARRRTSWPSGRATGGEVLVPFVAAIVPEVDVAAGRVVVDPPGRAASTATADERRRARRRRHDLPRLPRPARAVADRQGAASGPARRARARPARASPHDRHRTVDDTPYGGGAGMVMRPEPWGEALDAVLGADPRPAPCWSCRRRRGSRSPRRWRRSSPRAAAGVRLRALRGHRPRVVDEARTRVPVDEVSLGDYVLGGGEVAVLVVVEAVARLLPGVLGNAGVAGRGEPRRRRCSRTPSTPSRRPGAGRDVPAGAAVRRPRPDRGLAARDESLRRTAPGRPDLLAASTRRACPRRPALLAELGWQPDGERGFRRRCTACGTLTVGSARLWRSRPSADRAPAAGGAYGDRAGAPTRERQLIRG